MQALTPDHSPDQHLLVLRYHRIRMRRLHTDGAQALRDEVGHATTAAEAAVDAHETASFERQGMTAEVEALDGELDDAMSRLAIRAKAEVDNKVSDSRYQALFPVTPSVAMQPVVGDSQARFCRSVVQGVRGEPFWAPLLPLADAVEKSLGAVEQAVKDREPLYDAEAQAASKMQSALDAARRVYNSMPARLELLLGRERKRYIETFFKPLRAARKPATAPADDDDKPA